VAYSLAARRFGISKVEIPRSTGIARRPLGDAKFRQEIQRLLSRCDFRPWSEVQWSVVYYLLHDEEGSGLADSGKCDQLFAV